MTYLRPWTYDDCEDIAQALNNMEIQKNLRDGLPFPYTADDARDYIQSTLDAPPDSQYVWAIQWEGKAIGSIGFFRQGNIHFRTAELGYYIAQPYWGKGITTQAVAEGCRFLFAHTDLLRIYAEPFAHNLPSCRVLEKAGFSYEGTLRKNVVKNGQVLDMKLYALVKE